MKFETEPKVLAIIPARGGSTGIPRKNLQPLAGKPLIAHTVEAAVGAKAVGRVIVSTDDTEIAEAARRYSAGVVARPPEISGDTASSESALLHALDLLKNTEGYEPDLVVFLQCTSPIRWPDDIDNAVQALLDSEADSLLSVSPSHRFLWRVEDNEVQSANFDYQHRPRRQERSPEYVENGSIYVFKPWVLREFNNRLGGKIALYEMDYWSSFEIDTLEDLALCEWIMQRQLRDRLAHKLPSDVRLVVFDFDGVFTDNRAVVFQDGSEAVLCHRGDGHGLGQLRAAGIPLLVLSTEVNPVVKARCQKLQIECRQGLSDKKAMLASIMDEHGVEPPQVIFVGNDVNDLECMRAVGCGVAPADAHPSVLAEADLVLSRPGGRGAVRELCDLILSQRRDETYV
jgi:YrbI family 3-deoxy-D-manno-octulosonate 8-phosphate phosphatase